MDATIFENYPRIVCACRHERTLTTILRIYSERICAQCLLCIVHQCPIYSEWIAMYIWFGLPPGSHDQYNLCVVFFFFFYRMANKIWINCEKGKYAIRKNALRNHEKGEKLIRKVIIKWNSNTWIVSVPNLNAWRFKQKCFRPNKRKKWN